MLFWRGAGKANNGPARSGPFCLLLGRSPIAVTKAKGGAAKLGCGRFFGKCGHEQMVATVALIMFPALMAFAGASDFFTMTISNSISLALLVGFLALALAVGLPAHAIVLHLSCGAGFLGLTFILFAFGWIGGGDAKLSAATAIWLGWGNVVDYIGVASVIGGVLTLVFLQVRKWPMPDFLMTRDWFARLYEQGNGVPYGIALAAAGLIVYPETAIWRAAIAGS
jgi:prepilin peptidase CpaA